MRALKGLMWGSLALIAWTHAGYPLAAAAAARIRPRGVRKEDATPSVSIIVAAHDEDDVIRRRVENLLALDYPRERMEIVVASDGSTDATDAIVEEIAAADTHVRLVRCSRGGKVAAQNAAVRRSDAEVVAFTDANAIWAHDSLRKLVRNLADPQVAYVCGQLRLQDADGTNREGVYWRYELWLRHHESLVGSITGGNGAIYAVRRSDYIEGDDPRIGHDLWLPSKLTQQGKRAVYEPEALALEKPARDPEDEYGRKLRMSEHGWLILLEGGLLRRGPPLYRLEFVSHRALRYGSGLLHIVLLASSLRLAPTGRVYRLALLGQLAWLGLAACGRARIAVPGAALAYYYLLVTTATVVGLSRYLRFGVAAVWEKAEGTR
jgi:cellulose synthase/poly-beta-1,6-N-acetylglucosamine synthase-like glycosyltransferase